MMGSSYEQVFLIIGIMIFAMGIGAIYQKNIEKSLLEVFIAVELLIALIGGFAPLLVYIVFVRTDGYIVILYGSAFLIGFLIGLEIPLLIRINRDFSKSLKENLSEILSMDYIGSLAGALVFVYLLLKYFALTQIGFIAAYVNLFIAILGIFIFRNQIRWKPALLFSSACLTLLLSIGILNASSWSISAEQEIYRDPIIFSMATPYQRMILTKRGEKLRLYINGQLQFSSEDEEIYHEHLVHLPMALADNKKKVLILGGGDGLALREVLKYPYIESVTLVDIDPGIIHMASTESNMLRLNEGSFLASRIHVINPDGVVDKGEEMLLQRPEKVRGFLSGRKIPASTVRIFNLDADRFLKNIKETFDVIIIDFPDPSILELAKLYSKEFYHQLYERLEDDGIFSVQSSSPYFANLVFLCVGKTLSAAGFQVIPYHDNVPSFGEWGWYIGWKKANGRREDILEKIMSMKTTPVKTRYITPDLIRSSLVFPRKWLEKMDEVKVNTRMNPVLVSYYNSAWKL